MATEVILKMARKMFSFFFQPQNEFGTQTNFLQKKVCVQNFIFFCVHKVVLDTQKLDFFSISSDSFFSKTLKTLH